MDAEAAPEQATATAKAITTALVVEAKLRGQKEGRQRTEARAKLRDTLLRISANRETCRK